MDKKVTKVFGILNVTPDSFSDGGEFFKVNDSMERVEKMIKEGVDFLDIGAESTRPDGKPVSIEEEKSRLKILPEIREMTKNHGIQISLDSRNPEVIEEYISYIDLINDVTGARNNKIRDLALNHNKKIVFMHSLSCPVVKGEYVQTDDIVSYLQDWLMNNVKDLCAYGFKKENLIFDPGIGFGNTPAQAIEILKSIAKFKECGVEILVGHARKSFLAQFGELNATRRDPETHAMTFYLAMQEVDYVRVHDIGASKRIIKMAQLFQYEHGLVTSLA